jgi:hypothetical protein
LFNLNLGRPSRHCTKEPRHVVFCPHLCLNKLLYQSKIHTERIGKEGALTPSLFKDMSFLGKQPA